MTQNNERDAKVKLARLRFFRDLSDDERLKIFQIFGVLPDNYDGLMNLNIQSMLFDKWQAKAQSPIPQNEQQEMLTTRFLHSKEIASDEPSVDGRATYFFRMGWNHCVNEGRKLSPPKQIPDGWKLVPIEPSDEHLKSMAIRSDHGLGVDGYYDTKPIQFGASHAQRMESTIREMRQLYEEAIGEGFYKLPAPTNTEVGE